MCTILRDLWTDQNIPPWVWGVGLGFFPNFNLLIKHGLFIERQVCKPPLCQWPLEQLPCWWRRGGTSPWDVSWESAWSPLISTCGVIKCWNISWTHPVHSEPSLLLWSLQGSSQFLLHGLALVWAPSRPQALLGTFLLEKVLFRAKTVARSLCWSKAVEVWGWLWCWASGCRDELFVPWAAGGWSCGWKESVGQGWVWACSKPNFCLQPLASSWLQFKGFWASDF